MVTKSHTLNGMYLREKKDVDGKREESGKK